MAVASEEGVSEALFFLFRARISCGYLPFAFSFFSAAGADGGGDSGSAIRMPVFSMTLVMIVLAVSG